MAPLTWKNVGAPDFSSSASMYAAAGRNFSEGFDSFGGALSGFGDARKDQRSAAAIPILAAVANEGDVAGALAKINGMMRPDQMSDELQQAILGLRSGALGFETTRAGNDSTRAATKINLALNDRQQTTFDRKIAKENQVGQAGAAMAGHLGAQYGGGNPALAAAIVKEAERIGADPMDLATVMSFETSGTFDPWQKGPTTQWGEHRGLIQMGEPQREQFGYREGMPVEEAVRASADYLVANGFKPGMSGMDLYSTINAGAPGRYSASDEANGGTWGSVADKWNHQMGDHRINAERLLGGSTPIYGDLARIAGQPGNQMTPEEVGALFTQAYQTPRTLRDNAREDQTYAEGEEALRIATELRLSTLPEDTQAELNKMDITPRQRARVQEIINSEAMQALQVTPDTVETGLDAQAAQQVRNSEIASQGYLDQQLSAANANTAVRMWSEAKKNFSDDADAVEADLMDALNLGEESKGDVLRSIQRVQRVLGVSPSMAKQLLREAAKPGGYLPEIPWIGTDGDKDEIVLSPDRAIELGKLLGIPNNVEAISQAAVQIDQRVAGMAALTAERDKLRKQIADGAKRGVNVDARKERLAAVLLQIEAYGSEYPVLMAPPQRTKSGVRDYSTGEGARRNGRKSDNP